MKKISLEAKFTYINYVSSVTFRLVAFIGIVLIIGIVNIESIINYFSNDKLYKVGINLSNNLVINKETISNIKTPHLEYSLLIEEEKEKSITALSSNKTIYDIVILYNEEKDKLEFHYNAKLPDIALTECLIKVQNIFQIYQLNKLGYSLSETENIIKSIDTNKIEYISYNYADKTNINSIALLIIFFIVFIYVVNIGNTIIEEKTSRISETLLSYISPVQMLIGKIVGMFLALLTHILIFLCVYFICIYIFGSSNIFKEILKVFNTKTTVIMVFMMIFGYINYAYLYCANSAFADSIQDINKSSIIQTVLICIAFYCSFVLQIHYDENLVSIFNYIPFISIFSNIVYTAVENPEIPKLLSMLFIQIFYTILVAYICTKRFRKGITNYGKKIKQKAINQT